MKKAIAILLATALLLSIFSIVPMTASAAESMHSAGAASGTTGDCTWTLDDEGVLTISGNGAMEDYYNYNSMPWGNYISKVIIEDGVTSIGDFAFYGCTGLTSVSIPDSVTSIGYSAFEGCTGLTSITIPDSVTSIGNSAFCGCTGLTIIEIPDSVTSIGDYAFSGCTELTSVSIPGSVRSIGQKAFYNCTNLKSVTIPASVTYIGYKALGYYDDNYEAKRLEAKRDDFTVYCYEDSQGYDYGWYNYFDTVVLVQKSDGSTGISFFVPGDADIYVKPVSGQAADEAAKNLPANFSAEAVYDISITKSGSDEQVDSVVEMKIPCDNEDTKIFLKEDDGTLTELNAEYKDGYLVFSTKRFGTLVAATPEKQIEPTEPSNPEIPETTQPSTTQPYQTSGEKPTDSTQAAPAQSSGNSLNNSGTVKPAVKTKAANPMTVSAKAKTVKAKKLKKKAQKVKAITVKNYQGKLSFKLTKVPKKIKKFIKISKKGVITFKKWKKAKKGTYKISVKITAGGNAKYNSTSETVNVKIKVK